MLYGPSYRCSPHIPLEEVNCGRQGRRLFRKTTHEVIWITCSAGYVNSEVLKITAPIFFNQRFEPGTLGSESQCPFTVPSWDLYVKSGDNLVNAKRRANEIDQSWCPADLFDRFSVPNFRYQSEATYRPYANTCSIAAAIHTWVLFTIAYWALTGQYSIVCYRSILANGLLWPGDQHRVSEGALYFLRLFSIGNLLKM